LTYEEDDVKDGEEFEKRRWRKEEKN